MLRNPPFNKWWAEISRAGDPARRPHLAEDAFDAGYAAGALAMREKAVKAMEEIEQNPALLRKFETVHQAIKRNIRAIDPATLGKEG